ncbi:Prl6a1 [Lemmus lemmus]
MFQLLLVSNLLWEYVVPMPMCLDLEGYNEVSIEEIFDRAIIIAQYNSNLTTQMSEEFDENFAESVWYQARNSSTCHTASLTTPEDNEQIQQTQGEFLLKETIGMLGAWNDPLHHIATELSHMEDPPNDIISKAKDIEGKIKELLEALTWILSKIHPGFPRYIYPTWSGLASLQSPDEETRFFALYNLLHCLKKDSRKVHSNLRRLQCQLVYKRDC